MLMAVCWALLVRFKYVIAVVRATTPDADLIRQWKVPFKFLKQLLSREVLMQGLDTLIRCLSQR